MRNRKLFATIISVAFSLVVVLLAIAAFTLSSVETNYDFVSETNATSAEEINEYLDGFIYKPIFILSKAEIKAEIEKNAYFEVVSIKKVLPDKLIVNIREREERVVVEAGGKYYFLDENGLILRKSDSADSVDGNVKLLKLTSDFTLNGGEVGDNFSSENEPLIMAAVKICSGKINGLRDNIAGIFVEKSKNNRLTVKFVEGSCVIVVDCLSDAEQKMSLLISVYNGMTAEERISARKIIQKVDGGLMVDSD